MVQKVRSLNIHVKEDDQLTRNAVETRAKKAVDFNLPMPPKVPRRIVPVPAGLTPPKIPRAQFPFWCGGEDWESAIGLGETINTNSTWSSLEEQQVIGDGPALTFADVRARTADQLHPFVEDDESSIMSVDSYGNPLPPLSLLSEEEHPRGRAKPGARPPPGYQPPPAWYQAPMSRQERAFANIRDDLARKRRIAEQRIKGTH